MAAGRFAWDMPVSGVEIESVSSNRRSPRFQEQDVQYAEIIAAALGVLILATIADQIAGRRGFFASLLVSAVGAACGAFLALRVFGISTLTDWAWVVWAMAGAAICLVAFFLFRNKR